MASMFATVTVRVMGMDVQNDPGGHCTMPAMTT